MTIEEARQIRKQYADADNAFRDAKKNRYASAAKVSAAKAKRDSLEPKYNEAIRFLRENNAL